ncbi:MAG: hypothetical protein HQ478_15270 [Chloroflexi bacterium]|nr:hypothetical protein [Chloroflexota bacterium]
MTTRSQTTTPNRSHVTVPGNADAVILALGNLARAQERGLPDFVLEQLTAQVMYAAGDDSPLLEAAA